MNTQLINAINSAVSKVEAARRLYGNAYVDSSILPQHEENVVALIQHYGGRTTGFGSFALGTNQKGWGSDTIHSAASAVQNWIPPSEVIGFRNSDGTVNSDPQLIADYTLAYQVGIALINNNYSEHDLQVSGKFSQSDLTKGVAILEGRLNYQGPKGWQRILTLTAHPVTGSDVLNTAYGGSTQAIDNALTTALASLASQRDTLKAQLQSQHDAVTAQINSALTQYAGNSAMISQLNQQQAAADQALASALSGLDTDYNNAVAQAQAEANQQQQAIAANLTDIVGVQGISTIQNQLSNLLLNPVGVANPPSSVPYPTPTFTAPPAPYAAAGGFSPVWDKTNGDYYVTIYDYATGAQATAVATSSTSSWINQATGQPVQGPPSNVPPSGNTQPGNTVQPTAPTNTTGSAPYPTPLSPQPSPPYAGAGTPTWDTTHGLWTLSVYDYGTGQTATAYWNNSVWVNSSTNTQIQGPPNNVPPPTSSGTPSGGNYYTDAQGNIWVQDPTTGQYTLYMSGTGTTGTGTTSLPTSGDQSGTVPADYYMFSDTGSTASSATSAASSVYGLGSDGNYYVQDPTTGAWTYYAPGPNSTSAPAAAAAPAPTASSPWTGLFGWNF